MQNTKENLFKSKEELIKSGKIDKGADSFNEGYREGIKDAFKSIAERKEFYKKYRKDPEKFFEDQQDLCKVLEFDQSWIDTLMSDEWRDWFFDFCFNGVE